MCFRLFYRWWWCWSGVLGEWISVKIPRIPLIDDVFFHSWDLVACSPDFGLWLWQEPYLEDTLWTWRRTYWQQSFRVVPRMGSFFYSFSGARPGILNKLSRFGRVWRRSEACGLMLTIERHILVPQLRNKDAKFSPTSDLKKCKECRESFSENWKKRDGKNVR